MIQPYNIIKKDGFYITVNLAGVLSQTAGYFGVFFTARKALRISHISEVHTVAGSDGSAVTLDIERLQGTEALGSGDDILKTTFNLKSTANTVVNKKGIDLQNTVLSPDDRIALKDTGALTDLQGVCITIYLYPMGKGYYE